MKLQTKKIIAREFLILLIVIGLGVIGFFCTYPYILFKKNHDKNLMAVIEKKKKVADSLNKLIINHHDPFAEYGGKEIAPQGNIYSDMIQVNKIQDQVNKLVQSENQYDKQILDSDSQIHFGFIVIIIFLILLFGFRYLYYAIRWSIKTLSTK